MSNFELWVEMGCSTLVKALLELEKREGEHSEVEFTFEFAQVDYRITVARLGCTSGDKGALPPRAT